MLRYLVCQSHSLNVEHLIDETTPAQRLSRPSGR